MIKTILVVLGVVDMRQLLLRTDHFHNIWRLPNIFQFSGFTPIDYTSKFQRLHYGAFLFNMEFLDYTQYIDEHNIFDLNALKNTTDTFVSGKQ